MKYIFFSVSHCGLLSNDLLTGTGLQAWGRGPLFDMVNGLFFTHFAYIVNLFKLYLYVSHVFLYLFPIPVWD